MRYVSIPGYAKEYRISEEGVVQRKRPNGSWTNVAPSMERSALYVKLRRDDGTRHSKSVRSLMRDAFFGGPRKGYCLTSANGMKYDCSLYNLRWKRIQEARATCGRMKRKPVVKINRQGEVVEFYGSIVEAAKKNYVSTASVSRRCNQELDDPFGCFDFTFEFER